MALETSQVCTEAEVLASGERQMWRAIYVDGGLTLGTVSFFQVAQGG